MLERINLSHIDKSDWETYRFEEIATKISKTVKPEEAEVDIYVGLEHLDAEDIHIRRKGVPADVKGGKLRCSPGDVIFGKRRAYQRKAAIVDFEGICSAHAFVFRANSKVIDLKLFPFFLHSDQFMHRMVDISVGGLSPTINWGDLKHQEFLLPPKEEQAKLAELLWAMDKVIEKEKQVNDYLKINKKVKLKSFFNDITEEVQLREIGEIVTGSTPATKKADFWNGNIQFVTPSDLETQINVKKTERYITDQGLQVSRSIPPNAVMVVCIASVGKMGISTETCATNQQINTVIPNENISTKYLYNTMDLMKHRIINRAANSVVPILNKGDFELLKMPVLKPKERDEFVRFAEKFDTAISESVTNLNNSKSLRKSLITQIF